MPARALAALAPALLAALLTACGSAPPRPAAPAEPAVRPTLPAPPTPATAPDRDGPEANPPPDLLLVPDATPRLEPVRPGGPNKPYEVMGQAYVPLQGDPPLVERGLASWYGRKFHGRGTATGEAYNMYAMTAAHRTMPLPSYARVRNPANGREVIVRVNDRGPFHSARIIDLSYTAALKLGVLGGVAPVEIERITYDAIRAGNWRAPADGRAVASVSEPAAQPVADPIGELLQRSAAARADANSSANTGADARTAPPARGAPSPVAAAVDAAAQALPQRSAEPPTAGTAAAEVVPARAAGHRGFWLQLGAFKAQAGAIDFQHRVAAEADWLAPLLAVFGERGLHRLQAGPYGSRADAQSAAERLRAALQLVPAIVERR
jgi:rare lipoprotein A